MRVAADFSSRWRCCKLRVYVDDLAVQSHGRFLEQVRQLAAAYAWLARAIEQCLKLIIARDKQHGIGSSALVRATLQTQLRPRGVSVAATAKLLGGGRVFRGWGRPTQSAGGKDRQAGQVLQAIHAPGSQRQHRQAVQERGFASGHLCG